MFIMMFFQVASPDFKEMMKNLFCFEKAPVETVKLRCGCVVVVDPRVWYVVLRSNK